MCWFAGGSFSDKKLLQKISYSLNKRAKWNTSHYVIDELSFFHAPLNITDTHLDTTQPYVSGKLVIGLVWEIYNKQYLLQLIGKDPNTDISEIELIAECYTLLWTSFANYLNGEFIIFLFDKTYQKYYLFRDRYGVHTAYYTVEKGVFYFSSQMQDLCHVHSRDIHITHIQGIMDYYMFWFSISPHTFIPNIFVVEPGSFIEFSNGNISTQSLQPYIYQHPERSFIQTLEQSVIRRIPVSQDKVFMPISGWADSNLILYFLHKHFKWEIIAYTFSNTNNVRDVETARWNVKKYGLKHLIIPTSDLEESSFQENIWLHEGLVELYNMSWELRQLYPEYCDVHVEFTWDGREELLRRNDHYDYEKIQKRYEYLKAQRLTEEYSIDNDFLNLSMFDFNLQLIEKLTLWSLIERRLPFTDYELFRFSWYDNYTQEAKEFLKDQWIDIVEGIYGHNTWIYFRYFDTMEKILSSMRYFNMKI